jgi:predicted DCC family thiol-disulfide oxidoreductase YuxK
MSYKPSNAWLFFDGECAFCCFCIRLFIRLDYRKIHRYSEIQNNEYKVFMESKGIAALGADSVIWISENKDHTGYWVKTKSDAVIAALATCGGYGKGLSYILLLCPRPIRDYGYTLIARIRHVFGYTKTNVIPEALRLKTHAT